MWKHLIEQCHTIKNSPANMYNRTNGKTFRFRKKLLWANAVSMFAVCQWSQHLHCTWFFFLQLNRFFIVSFDLSVPLSPVCSNAIHQQPFALCLTRLYMLACLSSIASHANIPPLSAKNKPTQHTNIIIHTQHIFLLRAGAKFLLFCFGVPLAWLAPRWLYCVVQFRCRVDMAPST